MQGLDQRTAAVAVAVATAEGAAVVGEAAVAVVVAAAVREAVSACCLGCNFYCETSRKLSTGLGVRPARSFHPFLEHYEK